MREEEPAEAGRAGMEKVKSEFVNEFSELLDVASTSLTLTPGPDTELDFDAVCKIVFSSENWLDMQYIILRRTRSYLPLVSDSKRFHKIE